MSIASEINRIKANIADAYDEAEAKGATMPQTQNSANLADTIGSIETNKIFFHPNNGREYPQYLVYPPNITVGGQVLNHQGCTELLSVDMLNLPGTLTLGQAFFNCSKLKRVILSNDLKGIYASAFANCSSLEFISPIPKTVTTIASGAFGNCTALLTIDLSHFDDPANIPTLSSTNALSGTSSNQIIYVKNQEMLGAFSAATNWSTYANRFQIKGA